MLKNLRIFQPQATAILTAQGTPCNRQYSPAETRRLWQAIAAEGLLNARCSVTETQRDVRQAPRGSTAARAYATTLREPPGKRHFRKDACAVNPETALRTGKHNSRLGCVLEGSQLINLNHLRTIGTIHRSSIRCCRNVWVVHPGRRISRSRSTAGSGLAR